MDNSDKQMEMLLEEGGIADDGMSVDPVSGNEVPPGSMASEVRDDIPAQLSEGEYVVPADVLRFYGVKFFEDLRNEAKMGLSRMEQDGRIGGEPVAGPGMGSSEDLTPEEMAELESMMMAVGGYVPQPAQPDPYMQQQAMYNQGAPVAIGNSGYAEGGLEDGETADYLKPTFDPSMFQAGFSFLNQTAPAEPQIRVVTMYGPNGEVETVTLPTQQARYDELLALGYSDTQVETTTETTVGKEEPEGGGLSENDNTPSGPSISEMTAEELGQAAKGLNALSTVASVVGTFSPVVGLGLNALAKAQQNAINNRAVELGIESPFADTEEDQSILDKVFNTVTDLFSKDKETTTSPTTSTASTSTTARGSSAPSSATANVNQAAAEEAMGLDPFGGEGPSVGGGSTSSSSSSQSSGPDDGSRGGSTSSSGTASAGATGAGAPGVAGSDVGTGPDGTDAVGPMNTGGLVKRRSKKKKK